MYNSSAGRSKLIQSKKINELKNKLKPRQVELQTLHKRNEEIDAELKKSRQYNDNLRVKVENVERKLTGTKKELASKIMQVKKKTEEVYELETKLQDLSNYVHDFNSLKKQLTKLSHEYDDHTARNSKSKLSLVKKQDAVENGGVGAGAGGVGGGVRNLNERKIDVLKKKIKGKQEILKRNKILHQGRLKKLKSDRILLEKVSFLFFIILLQPIFTSPFVGAFN